MPRLENGDLFPTIRLDAAGGGAISLPADVLGSYVAVLFYRGSWCPYCNAQLAAFSRASDRLAENGIKVVALSADDKGAAEGVVEKHRLKFPVGFGADAGEIAAMTGAYVNDEPRYLQSTGFVLDPQGRVITAVYSSAAIGRLMPDDVIGFVSYVKSHG